jgi:hypothetical protein
MIRTSRMQSKMIRLNEEAYTDVPAVVQTAMLRPAKK